MKSDNEYLKEIAKNTKDLKETIQFGVLFIGFMLLLVVLTAL